MICPMPSKIGKVKEIIEMCDKKSNTKGVSPHLIAAGPSKQPGCISLGRRESMKIIPVLLATTFPVLKSTRHRFQRG